MELQKEIVELQKLNLNQQNEKVISFKGDQDYQQYLQRSKLPNISQLSSRQVYIKIVSKGTSDDRADSPDPYSDEIIEKKHKEAYSPQKKQEFKIQIKELQANQSKVENVIPGQVTQQKKQEKKLTPAIEKFVNGEWIYSTLHIADDSLVLREGVYNIHNITKVKIYPNITDTQHPTHKIVKITYFNQKELKDVYLSGSYKKKKSLNSHFKIFGKIINLKMKSLGLKSENCKWNISPHSLLEVTANSYTYGMVYKKSNFIGEWHERFIVIRDQGIFSYRNLTDKNHSFMIQASSIKYMWSRFQFVEGFLIIKVKHGLFQTQFGIPICEFDKDTPSNWLLHIYHIAVKSKEQGENEQKQ